ncbi:hypothetical protein H920_16369 [Fukomys damarensis]|uniref:Uncharacterized protein n=1 Tax=Fukomys damarensis TaxID=885580 RepID=A0A091CSF9_FUKDA|nr:hypothetical protein H920_16369 [Fukomys damarensis]
MGVRAARERGLHGSESTAHTFQRETITTIMGYICYQLNLPVAMGTSVLSTIAAFDLGPGFSSGAPYPPSTWVRDYISSSTFRSLFERHLSRAATSGSCQQVLNLKGQGQRDGRHLSSQVPCLLACFITEPLPFILSSCIGARAAWERGLHGSEGCMGARAAWEREYRSHIPEGNNNHYGLHLLPAELTRGYGREHVCASEAGRQKLPSLPITEYPKAGDLSTLSLSQVNGYAHCNIIERSLYSHG